MTTSKKVAHWIWQRGSAVIVVILLIITFAFGYNLGSGPAPTSGGNAQDPHAGHDAGQAKAPVTEWTCAMHPQIRKPTPGLCPICGMKLIPASGGTAGEGMRTLTISPQAAMLLDIQTMPVERKFVEVTVSMVGKIDYDETRLGYLTAYVGGRLDRLFVDYTGVTVKQGDHMVELYSPELLAAQEELLQAIQAVKSLKQSDISIMRETAQATVVASREKLRLWGLTKEQIAALEQRGKPQDNVVINSPLSGIVIHKNAQEGMYVQTGTRIYTIADLTQLWVKFDAYESDLIWLRYGQSVTFTTEAYPGEVFRGQIAFIDPVLDDVRRTAKVRVNVSNENGRLKPGMFARGIVKARVASGGRIVDESLAGKWISPMHPEIIKDKPGLCDKCGMPLVRIEELGYVSPSDEPTVKPLVIPTSAVLTTGTRAIVYVKVPGAEQPTFEGREIVLGPRAGDHYIVYSNLREGELVVTNGSFKLDSELQLRAKPSMMTPEGGGGGGHDHGGRASQQKSTTGAGGAGVMNLPDEFVHQWRGVERAASRIRHAVEAGDIEQAQRRYRQFLLAMRDVEAGKLSGHALAVWVERSMRLTNDAVEGMHAKNMNQVRRPTQLLDGDLARTREQLGLKAEHIHLAKWAGTEAFGTAIQRVLTDYFALSDALAADDAAKVDVAATNLRKSLAAVDAVPTQGEIVVAWKEMKQRLIQTLSAITEAQELSAKRAAFQPFSQEVSKVVIAVSDQLSIPVYEAWCPMAFNNKGGTWLQQDRQIMNPYFGSKMLRCGDVIGTLSFDPAQVAQVGDAVPVATALGNKADTPAPAPLYQTENLGAMTSAYFQLADALTAGDHAKAKSKASLVQEALDGVKITAPDGKKPEAWTKSSTSLATAIDAIGKSTSLEQARQGFALLSEELVAVLRASGGTASPVYRVKCPMAFNNRGATWLQNDKNVINPYFGDQMLRCGSVIETITASLPASKPKGHQHD